MSDDYLWDRSGLPEPDELELESLLGPLRYTDSEAPNSETRSVLPVHRDGLAPVVSLKPAQASPWRAAALAGLVAAAAAAGWLVSRPPPTRIGPEVPRAAAGVPDDPTRTAEPKTAAGVSAAPTGLSYPPAPPPAPGPSSPVSPTPAPDPGLILGPAPSSGLVAEQPNQGGLSVREISAGVARHRRGIARHCWQPALKNRRPGAPGTVRLAVRFEVLPSGQVTDVSLGKVPAGYPGLGECVLRQVASWSFPKAGNSTLVRVPLVFSAE